MRRQALLERMTQRREWDLWEQLPRGESAIPYPDQAGELKESDVQRLSEVYTSTTPMDCPICMNEIVKGDKIVALECDAPPILKHMMCFGCARKWMTESWGSCPLCKRAVQVRSD